MRLRNANLGGYTKYLLVVTIFLQSFSFLSLKISVLKTGGWSLIFLLAAFGFMGFRALAWQKLLHYADLSLVYPFSSLVQVLLLVYAVVFFRETITQNHITGMLLMLSGVFIMSRE